LDNGRKPDPAISRECQKERVEKPYSGAEIDIKVEKDMIELTILEAAENIEKHQKETKAWKDRKVVRKDIKTGDLVLKRKKSWENPGKLQEPWEGSYIAKETSMTGAFSLLDQTGEELSYSWNADSLKKVLPLRITKVVRFIFSIFFRKF
jgi:hypothetical protein